MSPGFLVVSRGEIYTARLDPTEGSELQKTRPVLIVSNDIDNQHSPVVLVAPLTTHRAGRVYPGEVLLTQPEGGLAHPSRVCCTQVRVLDKRRLCDAAGRPLRRWGRVSQEVMGAVNEGLLIALGLL